MEESKIPMEKPPPKPAEPDDEFQMRTCCGQISSCDKPLCTFLARFVISSVVLGFSMVMLVQGEGDSAFYSSTVSLILGTYLSESSTPGKKEK